MFKGSVRSNLDPFGEATETGEGNGKGIKRESGRGGKAPKQVSKASAVGCQAVWGIRQRGEKHPNR